MDIRTVPLLVPQKNNFSDRETNIEVMMMLSYIGNSTIRLFKSYL